MNIAPSRRRSMREKLLWGVLGLQKLKKSAWLMKREVESLISLREKWSNIWTSTDEFNLIKSPWFSMRFCQISKKLHSPINGSVITNFIQKVRKLNIESAVLGVVLSYTAKFKTNQNIKLRTRVMFLDSLFRNI